MPTTEPPLVDLKVTNPVTYLKRWWARVIGNEGMEVKFKIHPLTMIAIAVIISGMALGVGRLVLSKEIPFFKFEKLDPSASSGQVVSKLPSITPDPWRETGFTGVVQYSTPNAKYFLMTSSSAEAIYLQVPDNVDLGNLVGKRIFATGRYNKITRTLLVVSATDLEVLPKNPSPIPTTTSTPAPSPAE